MTVSRPTGDAPTPIPASSAGAGATNTANPHGESDPSGNHGSGELRAKRVADTSTILAVAFHGADYRSDKPGKNSTLVSFVDTDGDRSLRPLTLGEIAAALDVAGYRLVSEDTDTVERLAAVMHSAGCGCGMSLDDHQAAMRNDFDQEDPAYAEMARAAIQALRDGGQ